MQKYTLTQHIRQLKVAILKCLAITCVAIAICYFLAENILKFLAGPLIANSKTLIYTSITEVFFVHLKIAFVIGIAISVPFYLWQIYNFCLPGLKKVEKQVIITFFTSAIVMFVLGCAIMYYFILPGAINFLLSYEDSEILSISLNAKIEEYISTIIGLAIGFGLAFQMPIVLLILAKMQLITSKTLQNFRRKAIVLIFIIAAIATPPDVLSQIMLAFILILFYEVTILLINFTYKNTSKNEN